MICNRDCQHCEFEDCIEDESTAEEMRLSDNRDKQVNIILSDDYRIRWVQRNKERNRLNKQKYYIEHKEQLRERQNIYYQEHHAELMKKAKERYQKNIEYRRQWQREYRKKEV